MLDRDLADFYQIETRLMNRAAIGRNADKFEGCYFKLTTEEYNQILSRSQNGISNFDEGKQVFRGGYLPTVYTERGAINVAKVIKSKSATKILDLLLDAFEYARKAIKSQHNFASKNDLKSVESSLSTRIDRLEEKLPFKGQAPSIVNNVYGSGNNFAQITNNGVSEDLLTALLSLHSEPEFLKDEKFKTLVEEAIKSANNQEQSKPSTRVKDLWDWIHRGIEMKEFTEKKLPLAKTAFAAISAYLSYHGVKLLP